MTTAASHAHPLGDRDASRSTPPQLIAALAERFGTGLVLACSFQKEEAVLLDMLFAADPAARVFALDTHVLFPETYAYWRQVEERYAHRSRCSRGRPSAARRPNTAPNLWETAPDRCCGIRKVEPLGACARGA